MITNAKESIAKTLKESGDFSNIPIIVDNMIKPKLIMMVGLSASGKSTIAKDLAAIENAAIVSSDKIRGEMCPGGVRDQSMNTAVFEEFRKRIVDILKSGRSVIADATNLTIKSRAATLAVVRDIDCKKIAYIVPKPFGNCVADDAGREYSVGDLVINRQRASFQVPFKEEGFDRIVVHRFENSCIEPNKITTYLHIMWMFDQQNPHHSDSLGKHSLDVAKRFNASRRRLNRMELWAAPLFHDVGKLFTQTFDEHGVAHYHNHANVGAYWVLSEIYEDFSVNHTIDMLDAVFLINYHMLPFDWKTDKAREKWLGIFGKENFDLLMDFHECDVAR